MNNHWGYCSDDHDYKSWETLVCGLIGCVAQNGNLLLNIGPDASGRLPEPAVQRLRELAAWYRIHKDAVTGSGKSAYHPPQGCCYTQNGSSIYCSFLIPPLGDVILSELRGKIVRITHLRTGEDVAVIDNWGFELLRSDEQRIRPVSIRPGDILKIELR